MSYDFKDVPIGLGMALAQNAKALETFAEMSAVEREAFIARVRQAESRQQMRQFTDELTQRNTAQ